MCPVSNDTSLSDNIDDLLSAIGVSTIEGVLLAPRNYTFWEIIFMLGMIKQRLIFVEFESGSHLLSLLFKSRS